jgi:PAS domain S-box-containing protein
VKEKVCILHLKDDRNDAELISSQLAQEGIRADALLVDTRENFINALAHGGVDLILADFKLSSFDGLSALAIAQEKCPDVPFIFVTGAMGEEAAIQSLKSGATDYVLKDKLSRLAPAVRRALKEAEERFERRRAEERLKHANHLYAVLSQVNQTAIRVHDRDELFRNVCDIAVTLGGFRMAWVGVVDQEEELVRPMFYSGFEDGYLEKIRISVAGGPEGRGPTGAAIRHGFHFINKDTENNPLMLPWREEALKRGYRSSGAFPIKVKGGVIGAFTVYSSEVNFFDETEIKLLDEITCNISYALDYLEREAQHKQAEESLKISEERFRQIAENIRDVFWMASADFNEMIYVSPAYEEIWGRSCESLYKNPKEWLDAVHPENREYVIGAVEKARREKGYSIEYRIIRPDGSVRWIHDRGFPVCNEPGEVYRIAGIAKDVTGRKKAENELRFRNLILSTQQETSLDGILVVDEHGKILSFNQRFARMWDIPSDVIESKSDQSNLQFVLGKIADSEKFLDHVNYLYSHPKEAGRDEIVLKDGRVFDLFSASMLGAEKKYYGRVWYFRDITDRKKSEQQIQHQLKRLGILRDIDIAITSSLDLRITMKVILDAIVKQPGIDAADILLLNTHTLTLEHGDSRGFRTDALKHIRLHMGEGLAGVAALERRTVRLQNLSAKENLEARMALLAEEGFSEYFATPLISKGQVKGVLEVFQRHPTDADQEWIDFLEALATQTAIAIDHTEMFKSLVRSNMELTRSYDTTLEGWSRALDYRDKETEGHSQRVTEMAVKMGSAIGMSEQELVHVRRGALLHDIGKLGVPDKILLKPGPLNDEEWEAMRKHPVFAHELLSPIPFLSRAIDIPFCHHEKWDGSGYPRGLQGEQIPLSARIFAIVDVWDALSSDRPYRPAWSRDKVFDYLNEQAGKHFDPKLVAAFWELDSEQIKSL